MSDNNNEKL